MFRLITTLLATAVLAGCAARGPAGLNLDTSVTAVSQASRVRSIVLHYTSVDDAKSMQLLSQGKVSSHYLINESGRAYRLVDESRAAWHAGASSWYGNIAMNSTSIGIEIVNAGWTEGTDGKPVWHAYDDRQVRALTILLRDIIQRHGIAPENVVGHSDIAPQRKVDPGPLFPWKALAQAGIGRWYDESGAASHLARLQVQGTPDVTWFQKQLARLGYACPQDGTLDRATINTLAAFQMHYRPALHDGQPDAETAAIMLAIL
ncbi:N-acetylmuramoyl-L-alanine amidase [Achromobacter seleniivolatilans]|uniref:N-acetylmuramoyl-L-alanine amidase n=1 Tax=Achromobacter seleniivolatilans TaxID=3047478 RepID=A0ABY9LUK3_9BURK|nr:N-acetylmuramoyl-L-alanine amidase [Achromobacter sp. R39]WMD18033.1 N-acetylmuramoyl-L-alanine amidase [Achromobacter sp. R39]